MAFDTLLKLFPEPGSAGNISGAAVTQGSAKFLGRNRTFRAIGRCGGDVTGAGAALSISLEEATTSTGTWTAIPGSMAITEQVGYVSATGPTARPEVPSAVLVLPSITFTTTKDYVRVVNTATGTTPVFPAVSVHIEALPNAILNSGR